MYMKWKACIHPMIELVPIELAGRGTRINESRYKSLEDCIEDVYRQILYHGTDRPYAIFGHSMGAIITFEVARKLTQESNSTPMRLFLSGCGYPQSGRPVKKMYQLTEAEIIEELRKLGGTLEEILIDPEMRDFFLPIIRDDHKMLYSYKFQPPSAPMDIALTILNGKADDLYPQEISGWQKLTSQKCEYLFFEGGHFFIEQNYRDVGTHINSIMVPVRM